VRPAKPGAGDAFMNPRRTPAERCAPRRREHGPRQGTCQRHRPAPNAAACISPSCTAIYHPKPSGEPSNPKLPLFFLPSAPCPRLCTGHRAAAPVAADADVRFCARSPRHRHMHEHASWTCCAQLLEPSSEHRCTCAPARGAVRPCLCMAPHEPWCITAQPGTRHPHPHTHNNGHLHKHDLVAPPGTHSAAADRHGAAGRTRTHLHMPATALC
jgi:hypothetical protein